VHQILEITKSDGSFTAGLAALLGFSAMNRSHGGALSSTLVSSRASAQAAVKSTLRFSTYRSASAL